MLNKLKEQKLIKSLISLNDCKKISMLKKQKSNTKIIIKK